MASRPEMASRSSEPVESVPLQGMRGVIARTMVESLRSMAQFTLQREVEASGIASFRGRFARDARPSVNDVVLAAVARTLPRHPALNATLEDETVLRRADVQLGMAVAVDAGLVVPVIRDADTLSLDELRAEAARLRQAALAGRLTMEELQGGTFTVSNLGGLGIDAFTPVVNPPQVAILGVGRIRGDAMTLSLTIDHRALDGAPGALFLADLAEVLQGLDEEMRDA